MADESNSVFKGLRERMQEQEAAEESVKRSREPGGERGDEDVQDSSTSDQTRSQGHHRSQRLQGSQADNGNEQVRSQGSLRSQGSPRSQGSQTETDREPETQQRGRARDGHASSSPDSEDDSPPPTGKENTEAKKYPSLEKAMLSVRVPQEYYDKWGSLTRTIKVNCLTELDSDPTKAEIMEAIIDLMDEDLRRSGFSHPLYEYLEERLEAASQ